MDTKNIFKDAVLQKALTYCSEDMFQKLNKMSDEELLIYKAQLAVNAARAGDSDRAMELVHVLIMLRSQMSDYRFNKVLGKLRLSREAAKELMKTGVAL